MTSDRHLSNFQKLVIAAKKRHTLQRKTDDDKIAAQRLEQQAEVRTNICISFGFKKLTDEHKKCMFELYKLEEVAKQNQMTRAAIANASAEQSSLLRQQIEEQKFESGMRLLQQSANILNAPSPTITCKYNAITRTTVCN